MPCDHLAALPASVLNYTHRILVGALAFFTSCHTATPTPVITPIFRGILQDWVLVGDDKHTADLVPHRITLHLAARFMEMVCLFGATARVPAHPSDENENSGTLRVLFLSGTRGNTVSIQNNQRKLNAQMRAV